MGVVHPLDEEADIGLLGPVVVQDLFHQDLLAVGGGDPLEGGLIAAVSGLEGTQPADWNVQHLVRAHRRLELVRRVFEGVGDLVGPKQLGSFNRGQQDVVPGVEDQSGFLPALRCALAYDRALLPARYLLDVQEAVFEVG